MAIRALDDDSETPVPKLPSTFRFLGDVSSGNSVPSNKDEGAVVAGVRGAAEGVVPGFAGLAGFGAGMKAAAPMAARASAMVPGIGVPGLATKALVGGAVAITGGLAGAFGASSGAAWVQDKLYALADPEGYKKSQLAKQQYPTASAVGSVVGGLAGMSPKTIPEVAGKFFTKPSVQRGTSAALTGAMDVGVQAATEDKIDWTRAAASAAGGFAAPGFNPAGRAAYNLGERLATRKPTTTVSSDVPPSEDTTKPPTSAETDVSKRIEANLREAELSTSSGKRLKEAAFMDTETGGYIPQGKSHDEMLKTDPKLIQGFLTEDNSFVTREEAAIIAKEQHADKLVEEIDPKQGLRSSNFGPERLDALKPKEELKSASEQLGLRTDTRKNFYEDLDNKESRLAMLTQEMENRVDSMSIEEQFAANKEINALEKNIEEARKDAPAFESKGQKQRRIESIPPEQRTLKEEQDLYALKQLGKHDSRNLDWEDTQDLLRGAKTATEALQRIIDGGHASWPLLKLSRLLIKNQNLADAKIILDENSKPFPNGKPDEFIVGEYDPVDHAISMFKDGNIQTFLHENIHAAVYVLQRMGTHPSAIALKKLYEDYKSTVSKQTQEDVYGLADELEFLAEAFSNPEFQKLLSTRYMLNNPSKTMWQGFKDIVKASLGIKKENQAASALDQVLDHGAVLLEEGFVLSKRTPTTGSKPVPSKGTAAPTPAVDPTRYDPRKVTDEADLKAKGKELYASKGVDAAREFFTGYEKYKETWLNPVKEVEDFVEMNINNKMADERIVINNSNDLKALLPDAAAREQVAIAIDAKKTDTLTGAAKEAADKYNGLMKDIGERALKEGVVKGLLENYVTHIVNWADMPKGALETFLNEAFRIRLPSDGPTTVLGKEMAPESRFGIERKIETFAQLDRVLGDINRRIALAGKDFKLEVKTKDIAEIYKEYASSMEKAIENKKLIDSILSIRNPNGESLVRRVTAEEPLPYGWQMINDRQFAGYAVQQDLAPALKFAFEAQGNKVLNAIYSVSQVTKRLNVIGSLFHAKSLMEVLSSAHTPIITPIKEVALGITDKLLGTEYSGIRKAINEFEKGGLGSSVDKWQRGGLVLEVPSDVSKGIISATGKFADSMISKFGPKTRILESALSATEKYTLGVFDKITWDYLHTGGKLMTAEAYLSKARENAAKEGKPFDETAARKEIVSFVNKSFGGLNWFQEARPSRTPSGAPEQANNIVSQTYKKFSDQMAMAAYSPEGRKGLQILLFAPDWTISTIKAFTAALPKELNPTKWHPIEGIKGMATPSTKADYARLYQFKTALTYLTLINGINLAVSGRNVWENKDPTRIEYPDGTSMQAMKHAMEPYHWISDPDKTLTNKLGFVPKAVAVGVTGLEYASPYAPKMLDPSAVNRAKAIASMALPFQASAAISAPKGEGVNRALLGTIGLPVYGQTKEQRKENNAERAKQKREIIKGYKQKERESGRQ
ncbi:hypothetical protein UFOVP1078_18 [uncultured Caudovirales phage]|uniref:Large polyvalent protein associated domain-containing protein n=1 Tax=uncultured Caudovirales phage TaxID=2100421 RepID=A0A6J5RIZ4_9CAUD|nr:hypothetical protein UFOVP289_29 [uncultured Caudovirales phage]CAB4149956.1 hypothetical protein UFOVP547_18 [uncultured Caudovirales phage]CAB4170122.1 hypothetical protein UFOVP900_51 [uncultured Caudovirales phage]CAB4182681.1 hypothetical protein UFOVP1078_18 [uncultured Caudovirales phage]CAB4197373.1 hypothetical protein UFOVP1317_8 [uncultured Caudovirales phage]